jgi:hypothetical protein
MPVTRKSPALRAHSRNLAGRAQSFRCKRIRARQSHAAPPPGQERGPEPDQGPERKPDREPERGPVREPYYEPGAEPDEEPDQEPVREPGHEVIVDNSPGVLSEGKAVVSVRTQPSHEPDHEPDHEPEYE